jgi:hypothetical protein
MRLTYVCIAVALATGSPAALSAEAAPVAAPSEAPKPKKICRPVATATGSHMGSRRVCRTAEQWRDIDRTDVDASTASSGRSSSSATRDSGN